MEEEMSTETVPALDSRKQKAEMLAAHARITGDGLQFSVPSQTLNGRYTVTREPNVPPTCTCPDFELRQQPCKHVMAVEIVLRRETFPDGTVVETRAARITYRQDWPAYNAAQTTEKEHFCRLLHDLCATVSEPAQTRGRPRLPISDRLFAAAFKVYSTMSGRRFMTDMRDACGRGLVAKPIHYNNIFKVIEDEDVTPILHDLITSSALPLKEVEEHFAVDSTGFGTSQFFRYYSMKYEHEQIGRHWIKVHAMVGTKTNVVTAVRVSDRTENDSPHFLPLVQRTSEHFTNASNSSRTPSAPSKAFSATATPSLLKSARSLSEWRSYTPINSSIVTAMVCIGVGVGVVDGSTTAHPQKSSNPMHRAPRCSHVPSHSPSAVTPQALGTGAEGVAVGVGGDGLCSSPQPCTRVEQTTATATSDSYQRQLPATATSDSYQRQLPVPATSDSYQRQLPVPATSDSYQRQLPVPATSVESLTTIIQRSCLDSSHISEGRRNVPNRNTPQR
jgi:hypothetical protein